MLYDVLGRVRSPFEAVHIVTCCKPHCGVRVLVGKDITQSGVELPWFSDDD